MQYEMKSKNGFEMETCSRCGGSGHYSYNQITGSRCFKCHGKKAVLTKRGQAAYDFYMSLKKVPVEQVKVGQLVRFSGMNYTFFGKVTEIGTVDQKYKTGNDTEWRVERQILITCDSPKLGKHAAQITPGNTVELGLTAEEKAPLLAKAHEFQATLTKEGKPMKQRKAA